MKYVILAAALVLTINVANAAEIYTDEGSCIVAKAGGADKIKTGQITHGQLSDIASYCHRLICTQTHGTAINCQAKYRRDAEPGTLHPEGPPKTGMVPNPTHITH